MSVAEVILQGKLEKKGRKALQGYSQRLQAFKPASKFHCTFANPGCVSCRQLCAGFKRDPVIFAQAGRKV